MKFGLKEDTIKRIKAVFATFDAIEEVILYGSRAKGNYKNGSDIDLTMKGDALNLDIISGVYLQLDDLLLPYMFDLSIYSQIRNPDLVEHINRVGITFYQKVKTHRL